MPKKAKSKAKSKAKLNIKKSKKGRRATPPKRQRLLSAFRRWRLLQRQQQTLPLSTKPPQRNQKAPRSNVVLTQMRQGRRWRSSWPLQRRQSAMPLRVRLRSRRQTTRLQSSTRLLKRPGERPRVAKPQSSQQGLPPWRWKLLQRKQQTLPLSTKPPQRNEKGTAEQRRSEADRQGRRWRSSWPLQRRQSAMSPGMRLRSRRQTTGPQSSPRLLKRPGERPRVAKPQPSEQGVPPRRKPGAKRRSRRSARRQRRRGSKPSSERSVKLPRRRSATLREKPSAGAEAGKARSR